MQGKGVIRFFLVLMTIVTLWQFFLIIPTQRVENNAEEFAQATTAEIQDEKTRKTAYKANRIKYLDSMSTEEILSIPLIKSFTYQELKSQQLAFGLDLKGGMSVVLQVDLKDFIKALANNSEDPTFNQALENASTALKNAQTDYITLFAREWQKLAGDRRMASIFSLNEALSDQINFETSDGEVTRVLRNKADETVDLTFKLLKERIDKLGVTQPNVSLDASRDLILVELPGIDNPERARNFLQAAANLEFWNVFRISDPGIAEALESANTRLGQIRGTEVEREILRIDTSYVVDSLGNVDSTTIDQIDTVYNNFNFARGPLFDNLTVNQGTYSPSVMGVAERNKRPIIDSMLSVPEIKRLFPREVIFRWSKDPIKDIETGQKTDLYRLFALKSERGTDKAPLTGDKVTSANANPDPQTNRVQVSLNMNGEGARTWAQMTTEAARDNNREIAIVLDNEVVSAPSVSNPIPDGRSSITGDYTIQEANDLANILQIGKLPARTQIIQESLVGPSLGAKNITQSLVALIFGFSVLLIFMIVYYGGGGIISILALFLNLFFILGALASYGTVLTLPGIAGIVLTIGMAVDANVIIYERIREELREGKSLRVAIQDGFANSYSAIIDANVTTALTAFVLAYFGLGPIKGFAVVLIIGVLSSIFTAVLVGRLIIDWWTGGERNLTFSNSFSENAFTKMNIDWLGKRRLAYMISGGLILAGLVSFFTRGFELGVDFKGGYSYTIAFTDDVNVDNASLRETLTGVFDGNAPIVKEVDTDNTYNVVTDYLVDSDDENASDQVITALYAGVNEVLGGNVDKESFIDPDGSGTHVVSSTKVGPTIADDIKTSAFYAAIFALLLIFLYIFIRFSKWQYSLGAVAALFHDVLVVLSIFSIFHGILPFSLVVDQAFIAAILTVIGYSINDTVVVFDRIREFLNTYLKESKENVINKALNSTISRTVITSLTTFLMLFTLFIFGGSSIKGFAFAILIGVIVGTYSSIFVATPIMSDLSGADLQAKAAKKNSKTGKTSISEMASKAK